MANAELKVAEFSVVCGGPVRVAGKGATGKRYKVESLKLKAEREEECGLRGCAGRGVDS